MAKTRERLRSELETKPSPLPNGPAAAAFLAGGIGSAVLGVAIVLVEMSAGIKSTLNWSNPVGPLSGKTGVATAAFLLSWVILGAVLKGKNVDFQQVTRWTVILIAVGILLTFPPVFSLFAAH